MMGIAAAAWITRHKFSKEITARIAEAIFTGKPMILSQKNIKTRQFCDIIIMYIYVKEWE